MDLYQELGKAVQDNISGKWEKVTVKIESSLKKMCSFQAEYTLSSFEKKELKFPLLTVNTLMDSVNKAVYTLEKNGHFDMTFEWDQTLQDEWDI